MIIYMQKEYTKSSDVISKVTKEITDSIEVSDQISRDDVSVNANLGNLEIYIPEAHEFSQYQIDDYLRGILPYSYTSTKFESGLYKMSVKAKLSIPQYIKLLKFIIQETGYVIIVED